MKKVIVLLSLLVPFFFSHEVVAGGEEMNWTSFDEYGIAFSLSSRWKVVDLSQKNRPTKERKRVYFASAKDKRNSANFTFFVRKAHKKKTLDEWVQSKRIPFILKRYSSGYGYQITDSTKKEISVGSGSTVIVEYVRLTINTFSREVVFIYFSHRNKYFYIVVTNNTGATRVDSQIVEKVFLSNLRLY